MRSLTLLTCYAALCFSGGAAHTQESDLAQIRATAKAFVKAFNDQGADAIAALWTENADYRDDTFRD